MKNTVKLFTLIIGVAGLLGVVWISYVLAPVILKEPTVYDPAEQGVIIGQSRFDFPRSTYFKLPFERIPRGKQSAVKLLIKYPEMTGVEYKQGQSLPWDRRNYISLFSPEGIFDEGIDLVEKAQVSIERRTRIRIRMQLPLDITQAAMQQMFQLTYFGALAQFEAKDGQKYSPILDRDLKIGERFYIEFSDSGRISTFINCRSKQNYPKPNCYMNFRVDDVYVEVSMSPSRFSDWQEIKNSTVNFIIRYRNK